MVWFLGVIIEIVAEQLEKAAEKAGTPKQILSDHGSDIKIYKQIYKQRTASERINSQAKDFGIERPKVRNRYSVVNLNTLTYIVINARALRRIREIKAQARAP